jgi:hypothetical protein
MPANFMAGSQVAHGSVAFNQASWIILMVAIGLPGPESLIEINQVNHRIKSKLNA